MRITKVTTKTGDDGKTNLGDGQRITKNHPIINALGDLDHLNSIIGWAIFQFVENFIYDKWFHITNHVIHIISRNI